ncbi:MAG: Protein TolB [Planctomycetes bacterium]|nr:Protein TolB [Planctomycetota bacterium]
MTTPRAFLAAAVLAGACASPPPPPAWTPRPDVAGESRLRNVRQLTPHGENAEAYWSWDDSQLVLQVRSRMGLACDQIFTMTWDGRDETMVSTGKGRTTCAYFLPGDREIVYASTHAAGDECPKPPAATPGVYTWPLFEYDIWKANADGTGLVRLTDSPGYDAEPTCAADGTIVFTSARDGDLEIYTMRPDGSDVRRLTSMPGYDGGAFFSPDGSKIVWRGWHPQDEAGLAQFRSLLAQGRVQPTRMDLWVMNRDGSDPRKITDLGGASFSPFFHPDGKRIIFSTNHENPKGRNFDLWLVNVDGTGLERVSHAPEFDSFPMFSRDGTKLVWASNRFASNPGDTNIFLADWVE